MNNNGQNGLTRWIFPTFFVILMWATLIGTFLHWDFYPLQNENRPMAKAPDFKNLHLSQWPDKINVWFEDHFGFRNTFIRRYNCISCDWLKRQPKRVVITDKGWLFTSYDGTLADFMGLRILSENELVRLQENLEGRQRWLKSQGINYLFVVAPNKAVIYPEELPERLQKARKRDGIEQLMGYLDEQKSQLNRLDMRHVLLQHKSDGMLYYSNDTHWTPLGSYIGYCALIKEIQKQMPQISDPVPFSSCTTTNDRWTGDLIAFVGDGKKRDIDYMKVEPPKGNLQITLECDNPEGFYNAQFQMIVINPDAKGTAVVLHDSFGLGGWRKLIPNHFHKTVFFIAARPKIEVFEKVIETYHPEIIIEEQVHRMVLHKTQPESKVWTDAFKAPSPDKQP